MNKKVTRIDKKRNKKKNVKQKIKTIAYEPLDFVGAKMKKGKAITPIFDSKTEAIDKFFVIFLT